MGTAGPSGFHSANTHREPGGKAGQIHRLGARGFTDRERKSRGGRGNRRKWGKSNRRKRKKQGKKRNKKEGPKGRDALGSFAYP